jgi:uncharacterized protein
MNDMRCFSPAKFRPASNRPTGFQRVFGHLSRIISTKIAALGVVVCLAFGVSIGWADGLELFRIGTGGRAGVYYPVGRLIAQAITDSSGQESGAGASAQGMPGHIGVAQSSGGSVANVRALVCGEIEAGLVQADVAAWAYQATHLFAGDESLRSVRAVASLYPENLQIVSRRDAGIRSIAQLKGKRISIDEIGSGTLSAMRIVLHQYGMSEADFSAVYLKPEFTIDKIRKGELHAFTVMAGVPMEAVSRIADIGLTLVPVDTIRADRIHAEFSYLFPGEIPDGIYEGVPATPTLQVHALLVVTAEMPVQIVHRLTEVLWSEQTQALLRSGHPQAAAISLETALDGISIPLHPGAETFYRARGMAVKRNGQQ